MDQFELHRETEGIPINDQFSSLDLLKKQSFVNIDRLGRLEEKEAEVLTEHLLEVYVNERLTMKVVCLPEYLAELVLGRLLTEGIVSGPDEIKSVYLCENGCRARVYLTKTPDRSPREFTETTPSCCTGSHILNDLFITQEKPLPVRPIPWKAEWVFSLADLFAEGTPLHDKTCGTHSCFLASGGKTLFWCEDIGRHNALDKAIGYAFRSGIDLSRCMVYSSGRLPVDMTVKAIRAGIPILASKAVPTAEAVALAKEYHLTLLCAARRDSMRLYAGDPPSLC